VTPKKLSRYSVGEIPDGLAALTQLARLGRQPGAGQNPVAELVYGPKTEVTGLYSIADSDRLPAARRIAAETKRLAGAVCPRCGRDNIVPLPSNLGAGNCMPCIRRDRLEHLLSSREKCRERETSWAREVVAGPSALASWRLADVTPASRRSRWQMAELAIATLDGQSWRWLIQPEDPARRKRDIHPASTPIADLREEISQVIRGKNIWTWEINSVDQLASEGLAARRLQGVPEDGLLMHDGLRVHYSEWVGEIPQELFSRDRTSTGYLRQPGHPGTPEDRVEWMAALVHRMAFSGQA